MVIKAINLLRKHPKLIGLLSICFFITSLIMFTFSSNNHAVKPAVNTPLIRDVARANIKSSQSVMVPYNVANPKTVTVILERIYLDGEISEEIVEETILSMEDFWAEYADWNLVDQDETQVVFQQKVDDISPLLKINGYFGISEEGILNIYEGKPSDQKIIQSFFQINTKELKSHQQLELKKGIPILSSDRYKEVLKMYKKYAKQEM